MITRGRFIAWTFEFDRIARALSIAREELAFRILAQEDWLELGCAMYSRSVKYSHGSAHNESGLFAFEREAIKLAFPPPPAAILVGACGGGRELFGLVEGGYRIAAAYDPVATFIDTLRADSRLSEATGRLCVGSHQSVEALPAVAALRAQEVAVDAVIIGWG